MKTLISSILICLMALTFPQVSKSEETKCEEKSKPKNKETTCRCHKDITTTPSKEVCSWSATKPPGPTPPQPPLPPPTPDKDDQDRSYERKGSDIQKGSK